ncbi:Fibroblast growth factor receptor 1 [Stylophora pistillata]|uniref:Fibroblast growth factor receptor 1 n=1 Tax=Stylophora pistillata TaxID=50429 RepID=A0A2B4RMK8_STYPI|nr:Fibroblast growth factor receptor 1 [Stylophora pistillata]
MGITILFLSARLSLPVRPVVKISSSSGNETFPIGADIRLTCKAEQRTLDKQYVDRWVSYIEWYDLQGRSIGPRCQWLQTHLEENYTCSLVLKNLTADKFGSYICQAGNGFPSHCTRESFKITILGAAQKLMRVPRDQSADIGANSNPRVKLINYPLDEESIQSQLFITGVNKEDFGEYQCEAKNILGKKLSLPAFFSPKDAQMPEIVEGPKNQSVSISSNAIFNCTAKGFPRPAIHWVKDNTSHVSQSNPRARVIQDNRTIRSQLLIKGVEMEDYGKYQCIAKNSIGRDQSGVAVLKIDSKNEEDSAFPIVKIAVFCALAAALICLLIVLVRNQLRNRGEEGRKSATKVLLEKDKYLINGIKRLESPNPKLITKSEHRPLVCTFEDGSGETEPPDGSGQHHSIQDIEERVQERLDWGEDTTGGDNVIVDEGVDQGSDEQGDRKEIFQETAEERDNIENLEVLDEILGEGEFGIVYKGRYCGKDGNVTDVAVKKLKDPNASAKKALLNEIRTLKHAGKHPNIVTLVGTRIERGSILVVTELIRGDSLENLLKAKNTPKEWNQYHNVCCKLNDRQLVTIAFQIATGMQHLEERKVRPTACV